MAEKFTAYDSADFLENKEDIAAYLDTALSDGEPALIAHAIGVVARASGMSKLAQDTGLAREALYRSLSEEGNPSFATVLKVTRALGLQMRIEPTTA